MNEINEDITRLQELRDRIESARERIGAARAKGFSVEAWEAQLRAMRHEHEELADKVFASTKGRAA